MTPFLLVALLASALLPSSSCGFIGQPENVAEVDAVDDNAEVTIDEDGSIFITKRLITPQADDEIAKRSCEAWTCGKCSRGYHTCEYSCNGSWRQCTGPCNSKKCPGAIQGNHGNQGNQGNQECKDKNAQCSYYSKSYCTQTYVQFMKANCAKTCGFCTGGEPGRPTPAPRPNQQVFTEAQKQEILDKHNELRRGEPATNMQTMVWDKKLEAFAQKMADKCNFGHSKSNERKNIQGDSTVFGYIGENIYVSSGSAINAGGAATNWWAEKKDYNYWTKGCTRGKMCGHYTQMAWATSNRLGCAARYCVNKLTGVSWSTGVIIFCNYGPGGNMRGQPIYKRN